MARALCRVKMGQAPGDRILPRGAGHFVDHGLHDEGRVCISYGTPPEHRNGNVRVARPQAHRQTIGVFHHALGHRAVDALLHQEGLERGALDDGLPDDDVVPREDVALVIECGIDPVQMGRPVIAALDVILATPHDLERPGRRTRPLLPGLGNGRTFAQIVGCGHGAASEAPACRQRDELDLRGFEAQRLGANLATIDFTKTFSLGELIDLGERRNPQTEIAWERAKQQAAQLGIARATLYPFLTSAIVGGTNNAQILLGPRFAAQDIQSVQPVISLYYTVFDFGRRKNTIDAAKFNSFSSDFSFNDVHERVIFDVTASYYQLLGAKGEVEAAGASLKNAQTVQDAVEARLTNGLATLPDALEARSASAQAVYELERAKGVERVARHASRKP